MSEAATQLPEEVEIELCRLEMESYLYTRGVRQGREEGEHHACEAIVATLEAALAERGIELDAAQQARIRSCNDPAILSRWLLRAATASTADELFAT